MLHCLASAGVLALLCSLATAPLAQSTPEGRLIGVTSASGPTTTPSVIQRQTLCREARRVCPSAVAPASGHAGGLAYDAIHRSVWHTQGTRMAEVAIDDCRLLCSAPASLTLGPGSVATGLALSETRFALYQLEAVPGRAALHTFHIRSCPPQEIAACTIPLPTNLHVAGAVAIDERDGFVFYAASVFGSTVPANQLLIARLTSPCRLLCRVDVPACGNTRLGAITGLAYDECSGLLFVTDGTVTLTMRRTNVGRPCAFEAVACCRQGPSGRQTWDGIDVESLHPEPIGAGCSGRNCRLCPNLALIAHGDPAIGNTAFALSIVDGQTGSRAFLAFNIGRCVAQHVPPLCGPYYPMLANPPSVILPMGQLQGNSSCDGQATLPIPVPIDYGLCGGEICFQGLVLCPSVAGPGISMTNGLQVRVRS